MLRIVVLSGALGGTFGLAATTAAFAQTEAPAPTHARGPNSPYGQTSVEANGRCNGISYGTGARRCGTKSGGPVGGISGRN